MTNSADDHDAAARWAIRLEDGPLDAEPQRELDDWLGADPRRHGALLRAEATLAYLNRGRALTDSATAVPEPEPAPSRRWSRRGFLVGGGMAAGLAAAGISGVYLLSPAAIEIGTGVGEIRRVPLPDGSVASVNTASDIAVSMGDKRRAVALKTGEAWFQVAHDRSRPFVVEAGHVRVQAVGTAFSVRRYDDGANVVVTEGVVEVWIDGQEDRRTRIAAGSKGFVANAAPMIKVETAPEGAERMLAWRTGELALNGETLSFAADELNRYNRRRLVIDSPNLRQEPMVGYFRVDQPEEFARAVGATLGATVIVRGDEIHLSR
ncbi:transmembrane sensor [Sphingomonas zeicaulis]|uniref:FecR family protein n=1 Tax=Sphingomonas zeicaulis TaxID=1632740 RepID=UPI003D1A56C6